MLLVEIVQSGLLRYVILFFVSFFGLACCSLPIIPSHCDWSSLPNHLHHWIDYFIVIHFQHTFSLLTHTLSKILTSHPQTSHPCFWSSANSFSLIVRTLEPSHRSRPRIFHWPSNALDGQPLLGFPLFLVHVHFRSHLGTARFIVQCWWIFEHFGKCLYLFCFLSLGYCCEDVLKGGIMGERVRSLKFLLLNDGCWWLMINDCAGK